MTILICIQQTHICFDIFQLHFVKANGFQKKCNFESYLFFFFYYYLVFTCDLGVLSTFQVV